LKAASEELNNSSFKADFISMTSHEMRTPLHGIIGEVDNLECYMKKELRKNDVSQQVYDMVLDSLGIINSSAKIQLMLVCNMLGMLSKNHMGIKPQIGKRLWRAKRRSMWKIFAFASGPKRRLEANAA
jgi:K+-sensing histidine kinase KdpD